MKILHFNEHLARKGGVETYLLDLLPRLDKRAYEQTFVYGDGDEAEYPRAFHLPALRKTAFSMQKAAYTAVQRLLKDQKPDLVHIHAIQNLGALKACLDTVPTVMTTHDYRLVCPASTFFYKRTQELCDKTCGPGCFTTSLQKRCMTLHPKYALPHYHRARWTTQHADRFSQIIAPSQDAKARLIKSGFDESSINVIPYFCPMTPADFPRPIPAKPVIAYIGRLAPNKGHNTFLEALSLLPESYFGIMVGNLTDELMKEVRTQAGQLGISERLELHPWASRKEIEEILQRTTVFVFPSLWPETLGIVGLEAMSRGVPVVASDIGGVGEWLVHEETGMLVKPKSPQQIRDAVLSLDQDHDRLRAYGENALKVIKQKFSPSRHIELLVDVYERAVDSNQVINA